MLEENKIKQWRVTTNTQHLQLNVYKMTVKISGRPYIMFQSSLVQDLFFGTASILNWADSDNQYRSLPALLFPNFELPNALGQGLENTWCIFHLMPNGTHFLEVTAEGSIL